MIWAMSRRRADSVIAFGVIASMMTMTSCGLVLPFDRFDTSSPDTLLFAVDGTVDGLSANQTIVLTLNGATSLTVGNGAFSFGAALASGAGYAIAVASRPNDRTCTVTNSAGTLSAADVTGVGVHCSSNDATLSNLMLTAGALSPGFSPTMTAYDVAVSAVFPPTSTTVTATARASDAHISIAGGASKLGSSSETITIGPQATIGVTVTAADGNTRLYTLTTSDPSVGVTVVNASNAATAEQFGNFGSAVAVDGDTVVVGAPGEQGTATGVNGDESAKSDAGYYVRDTGAAYVYVRKGSSWVQQAYVKASNTRGVAQLGRSVALSGDTLVVGAPGDSSAATMIGGDQSDASAPNDGAAYVFVRNGTTWTQQAYLKGSKTAADASFGYSLALSGDTLVVGAPQESGSLGAAYVFTRSGSTWSESAHLKASNGRPYSQFGRAVAMSGSTLAIGSPGESGGPTRGDSDPRAGG